MSQTRCHCTLIKVLVQIKKHVHMFRLEPIRADTNSPALENSLSAGTDVLGMHKYFIYI